MSLQRHYPRNNRDTDSYTSFGQVLGGFGNELDWTSCTYFPDPPEERFDIVE